MLSPHFVLWYSVDTMSVAKRKAQIVLCVHKQTFLRSTRPVYNDSDAILPRCLQIRCDLPRWHLYRHLRRYVQIMASPPWWKEKFDPRGAPCSSHLEFTQIVPCAGHQTRQRLREKTCKYYRVCAFISSIASAVLSTVHDIR